MVRHSARGDRQCHPCRPNSGSSKGIAVPFPAARLATLTVLLVACTGCPGCAALGAPAAAFRKLGRRPVRGSVAARPVCPRAQPEVLQSDAETGAAARCAVRWRHCDGAPCREPCVTPCDCPSAAPFCEHDIPSGRSGCVSAPPSSAPTLFFVHIPKTAGTSFRHGAERAFGRARMCYDYGALSRETSPVIQAHTYGGQRGSPGDIGPLLQRECRMISGHTPLMNYVRVVGLRRTISFVRRPLQRIVSEFHHHRRLNPKFNQTLMQFAADGAREGRGRTTMQLAVLGARQIPLEAVGFVGITERFAESLELLNAAFVTDIPLRGENAAPQSAQSRRDLEELKRSPVVVAGVARELAMYERAVALQAQRKRLAEACRPFAHGLMEGVADGVARGWAWWAHSDDAVDVEVFSGNGTRLGGATASLPHELAKWNAPRGGAVGFQIELPADAASGGMLVCRVAATGQLLGVARLLRSQPALDPPPLPLSPPAAVPTKER